MECRRGGSAQSARNVQVCTLIFKDALNGEHLRRFLVGDIEGSKEDLLASIKLVPSFTQSLVKIASVYMEQSEQSKTFECFEDAIKQNPDDPDIYYHRGQGSGPPFFFDSIHHSSLLQFYSL
jgi:Tfp pilus assembly protein PilF